MEIGFYGLEARCIIGILPHEREQEQVIDCDLRVSIRLSSGIVSSAAGSAEQVKLIAPEDEFPKVGYDELATLFIDHVREGRFGLLETLINSFVQKLLLEYPEIRAGFIEVRKPQAIPGAKAAFASLSW